MSGKAFVVRIAGGDEEGMNEEDRGEGAGGWERRTNEPGAVPGAMPTSTIAYPPSRRSLSRFSSSSLVGGDICAQLAHCVRACTGCCVT